jgi:hypothetical protein
MTLGTIGIGIVIVAISAYLELMDKDYEKQKEIFESK